MSLNEAINANLPAGVLLKAEDRPSIRAVMLDRMIRQERRGKAISDHAVAAHKLASSNGQVPVLDIESTVARASRNFITDATIHRCGDK